MGREDRVGLEDQKPAAIVALFLKRKRLALPLPGSHEALLDIVSFNGLESHRIGVDLLEDTAALFVQRLAVENRLDRAARIAFLHEPVQSIEAKLFADDIAIHFANHRGAVARRIEFIALLAEQFARERFLPLPNNPIEQVVF